MGGCLPCRGSSQAPKDLKLLNFPAFGHGEPVRLLLAIGRLKFSENDAEPETAVASDASKKPCAKRPALVIDGQQVMQKKAMARYLAKLVVYRGRRLYPDNAYHAAKVDEVMDMLDDLWVLLAPTFKVEEQQQKEDRRKLFQHSGAACRLLKAADDELKKSTNSTGFIVPQAGFTLADIMLFCSLSLMSCGRIEGLDSKLVLGSFQNLKAHKKKISSMPEIQQYYKENASSIPDYSVFLPDPRGK